MVLDAVTVRNLELTEPVFAADVDAAGGAAQATLLGVLDQTRTGHGRAAAAAAAAAAIDGRGRNRSAPGRGGRIAASRPSPRAELREQLGGMLDIERLLAKVTLGTAGPRDLLALGRSIEKIPGAQARDRGAASARLRAFHERLDELADVANAVLDAIADEPPLNVADGGTIRAGYHAELDELRDLQQNGQRYIAQIETRERAAHRHRFAEGALQ